MNREQLYAAVLPVIRQELPGIRGDLHRQITKKIAAKLAARVAEIYAANVRLKQTEKRLTAALERGSQEQAREIEKAMTALENMRKLNGTEG